MTIHTADHVRFRPGARTPNGRLPDAVPSCTPISAASSPGCACDQLRGRRGR
jgi:hypothetical protein